MKQLLLSILVLGLLVLLTLSCKQTEDDDPIIPFPQPQDLSEMMTNLFQPMVEGDTTVGVAVGLIKNGETQAFFFGESQKGGPKPNAETIFEIGSITKTMTATLLAKAVKDGVISLDDPVANSLTNLSSFPSYEGQDISFLHLANHTSSLPRLPNNAFSGNIDATNPYAHYTIDMLYDFLEDYELNHPIGSQEAYSNLGFGILGHALAQEQNTSFEQLLQEQLFAPLGMNRSFVSIPNGTTNVCEVYNATANPTPIWDMTEASSGAGVVKSCLDDMLKYLAANMSLDHPSLGPVMELAQMTTSTLNSPYETALAWVNTPNAQNGQTLTWHNGGTYGSIAFMGFIQELDLGVVLLFNTDIHGRGGEGLELVKAIQVLEALKQF